jgi:hypothetical protein
MEHEYAETAAIILRQFDFCVHQCSFQRPKLGGILGMVGICEFSAVFARERPFFKAKRRECTFTIWGKPSNIRQYPI